MGWGFDPTQVQSIEFNSPIVGVPPAGESRQVYSFTGSVGQQVVLDWLGGYAGFVELRSPNNTWLSFSSDISPVITLTQDGTYYLLANATPPSEYGFKLLNVATASRPLPLNVPIRGLTGGLGESQFFKFTGEAGQRLFFDSKTPGVSADWTLYSPDRTQLQNGNLGLDDKIELPADGEYLLRLESRFQSSVGAEYEFQIYSDKLEPLPLIIPGTGEDSSNADNPSVRLPIQLLAEDGKGGVAVQDYTIRLLPDPLNTAPEILSTPLTDFGLNQGFYEYHLEAFDANDDDLSYRLVEGPSGAFIDLDTGALGWFPQNHQAGEAYDFKVEVADGRGGRDVQEFEVNVHAATGTIRGAVFDDLNGNGRRDNNLVLGDLPNVLFVVDTSGSMGGSSVDWADPNITLENFDDLPVSIQDLEWASIVALAEQMSAQGRGDEVKVGLMAFGSTALTDMEMDTPDLQPFTNLTDDRNGNGLPDYREAIQNPLGGGVSAVGTSEIAVAAGLADSLPDGETLNVIFMSDGFISVDEAAVALLREKSNVNVSAFAIGEDSDVATMQLLDPEAVQIVRTEDLLDIFGGWDKSSSNEPFLENVTVYLDLDEDGELDENEPRQQTKPSTQLSLIGDRDPYHFKFEGVLPGTYHVRQVIPNGRQETTPTTGAFVDTVTVTRGETFSHLFGLHEIGDPPNAAPEFQTDAPEDRLTTGERWRYEAVALDPDADAIAYDLPLAPEGAAVDAETGLVIWKPQPEQTGIFDFILRVQDEHGALALQAFQVEVEAPNQLPVFTSRFPEAAQPQVGKPFYYQAFARDPDGDELTYEVVTGDAAFVDGNRLRWMPNAVGEAELVIKVSDPNGGEAYQTITTTVIEPQPNQAPVVSSSPRTSVRPGDIYLYKIEASDPDGDVLTFTPANLLPDDMTLTESGYLSWIPSIDQFGVPQDIDIAISDGDATINHTWTIDVFDRTVNRPPQITSFPEYLTNIEKPYQYQLIGSDPDGDAILWDLLEAPAGMVLDPETGMVSWQPTPDQIGDHTIAIAAIDSGDLGVIQEYTLTVRGANTPPRIISTPITQAGIGQNYFYDVEATDLDGDPLTASLLARPDETMTIDPQTGLIEWSPTTAGSYDVTVQINDDQGGSQEQTFTIEVSPQPVNQAPTIHSTPAYTARVGNEYIYTIEATDPDGDLLTYRLLNSDDPDFPSGLALSENNGQQQLTWTPTNDDVGPQQVVLAVEDGEFGAVQAFTLTVGDGNGPSIDPIDGFTLAPGQAFNYSVKATHPNNLRLTYELDAESQALGLTIDPYGRLSWIPPIDGEPIPDVLVTVTVRDPFGNTATEDFSLTVEADTTAPQVSLVPLTPVFVDDANGNPEFQVDTNSQTEIVFQAVAVDNIAVQSLELEINGTRVQTDADGVARVPLAGLGQTIQAVATATDQAGNTGQATFEVQAIPFSNPGNLVADFHLVAGDGLEDGVIIGPVNVVGTVNNGGGLLNYKLEAIPLAGGEPIELFAVENAQDQTDAVLGTVDPSLLLNDSYVLRLTVDDGATGSRSVEEIVEVDSELKLGNFRLSFTDLEVPVEGIPITVTRTYDSLAAHQSHSFGHGWRLEFRDTNLQVNVPPPTPEEELLGRRSPFRDGTRVYITLPGGERQSFRFEPQLTPIGGFFVFEGGGGIFTPRFVAEDGSGMTLSVPQTKITRNGDTGEYFSFQTLGRPYHPVSYTLTTKEGIRYDIDGRTGNLNTVTDLNGNQLTYSDAGIKSSAGKEVQFVRDAEGRITEVIDPAGQSIVYDYDANGDLVAVTDREGNPTKLFYEDDQRPHFLTRIEDPLGREGVRATYDENGRLQRVIDVNGEDVEIAYDPANSLQTVKDAYDRETTYIYNSRGNVVTEVLPSGKIVEREYYDGTDDVKTETVVSQESDGQGGTVEVRLKTEYTYDSQGNLLSQTDPLGNTRRYTYNQFGQLLTSTDPLGNTTTYTFDRRGNVTSKEDAEGNIIAYTYDEHGNPLTITEGPGDVTSFRYNELGYRIWQEDAAGNITTYTHDEHGNVETETTTLTNPITGEVRTLTTTTQYDKEGNVESIEDAENGLTEYKYDANGNRIEVIDPEGRVTKMIYDDKGQLVETIYPDDTPGDSTDNARQINIYDIGGQKRAVIDQNGNITHYRYDTEGQVVEAIYPDEEADNQVADLLENGLLFRDGYTPSSNQVGSVDWTKVYYPVETPDYLANDDTLPRHAVDFKTNGRLESVVDPRGNRTEYEFDDAGRLTLTRYFDENGDPLEYQTIYDKAGREIATIDPLNRKTEYKYDGLDRVVEVIYPDDTSIKTDYDAFGNIIALTDQEGRKTEYEYDDLDRLVAVIELIDGIPYRTTYEYDEAGNLVRQWDANYRETLFAYDGLGRQIALERPLASVGIASTTYDGVGNIQTTTDFNGDTIVYDYDELNRIISKTIDGEAQPFIEYDYELIDDSYEVTITDDRGATTYLYNERSLLESRTEPDGSRVSYTYNAAGLVETVTMPAGTTTTYGYDELNRLETVTGADLANPADPPDVTTYGYNDAGNLETTAYANGVVETRTYDDRNRLTDVVIQDSSETVLASYGYTLDDVGNITRVEELNGRTVDYTYDERHRLTKEEIVDPVNGNRTVEYDYDPVGNRQSLKVTTSGGVTETTYTYDANDRLQTATTNGVTTDYTYDNNGNLKLAQVQDSLEKVEYVWDVENRLDAVHVTHADGTTESANYEYDAEGVRVSKTANGVTTKYLIDSVQPYAQVLEEYTGSGMSREVEASYLYGLDLLQTQGTDDVFYLYDGHSGVRQLVDEFGAVDEIYHYDAYGNLLNGTAENGYLYRGEQWDAEADAQYLRARYYDPELGTFLSVDPFEGLTERPVTRHRYLYGNVNPVMFVDPSGMVALTEALGGITLGGVLSSIPLAHVVGVGGAIAGGLGLARGLSYVRNRFRNMAEWEGSLTLNALSFDLDDTLFGFDPVFGAGVGSGVLSLKSTAPISEQGEIEEGKWLILGIESSVGFFAATARSEVKAFSNSWIGGPSRRNFEGLIGSPSIGLQVPGLLPENAEVGLLGFGVVGGHGGAVGYHPRDGESFGYELGIGALGGFTIALYGS